MKKTNYLDTAATGLISERSLTKAAKYDHLLLTNTSEAFFQYLENDAENVKNLMAKFLEVNAMNIAFVPNFSYGYSMFLASVRQYKKRVLVFENDYPSLTMPLELQNFEVFKIAIPGDFAMDYEKVEKEIVSHRIEILSISHVQYNSGFTADLKALGALCQKHDVLFIVDGTQSLGALPIPLISAGIDVFLASNYKWMNGGFGSATAYFAEGILEKYKPQIAGFGSFYFENGQRIFKADAKSYEPGHFDYKIYLRLKAAIEEKQALGIENIQEHNNALCKKFLQQISKHHAQVIGPIKRDNHSTLLMINANEKTHQILCEDDIKCTFRNGMIRLSFHHTNTNEDVEHIANVLNQIENLL